MRKAVAWDDNAVQGLCVGLAGNQLQQRRAPTPRGDASQPASGSHSPHPPTHPPVPTHPCRTLCPLMHSPPRLWAVVYLEVPAAT